MTSCRLAASPADYRACHVLARQYGGEAPALRWPTVLARWGNAVVGFMATQQARWAVVMGPLLVAPDVRVKGLVALRLLEAYERVLHEAGVRAYVFSVATTNKPWLDVLEHRAGFERWREVDGAVWFKREVR